VREVDHANKYPEAWIEQMKRIGIYGLAIPEEYGGTPGKGLSQMMKGLETGRIQVASRALCVATAALEDSLAYAQDRESFGQPIWKHQAVGHYLADMATKLTAACQLTRYAAERYDSGERCGHGGRHGEIIRLRDGHGNRSECGPEHGGYGYSTEYDVERYLRPH